MVCESPSGLALGRAGCRLAAVSHRPDGQGREDDVRGDGMHRRCETDGDDRHQQIKIERGELAAERAGRLRRQRRLDAIAQTARAVTVMSAAMGSITGARQMTMTAISHIQGRPCGPLLPMRMCCAFRSGRAATGAAASPGGCRAVGFRPCYKTSIDDANRIG